MTLRTAAWFVFAGVGSITSIACGSAGAGGSPRDDVREGIATPEPEPTPPPVPTPELVPREPVPREPVPQEPVPPEPDDPSILDVGPPTLSVLDSIPAPSRLASDAFPIATSPLFQHATSDEWWYELNLLKPDCRRADDVAEVEGTVGGREIYWAGGRRGGGNDGEHPIVSGTFKAGAGSNHIELTIDRSSSGGGLEVYDGGWAAIDGGLLAGMSTGSLTVEPVHLLLTSRTTGRQFAIQHQVSGDHCR